MKKLHILIIAIIGFSITNAQEVHFSQNMNTPSLVNPALTGMFKGDLRASIQYKDQWNSWNNAFKTYALSFDMPILKDLYKKGNLALGINLYNDVAGSADFNTNFINISLSNIINLDEKNKLSAGLNFGYSKRSIDINKLQWGSQYDGDNGYNSMLPSNETYLMDKNINFDFSAGLAWKYTDDYSGFSLTTGASMYHLNTANISFTENEVIDQSQRAVLHFESIIPISKRTSIEPSAYYTIKGTESEVMFGGLFRTDIAGENSNGCELIYGSWYRLGDAIVPMLGININKYQLSISYDINISELNTASKYKGGLEIGFRFTTPNPNNKYKFMMGDKRI